MKNKSETKKEVLGQQKDGERPTMTGSEQQKREHYNELFRQKTEGHLMSEEEQKKHFEERGMTPGTTEATIVKGGKKRIQKTQEWGVKELKGQMREWLKDGIEEFETKPSDPEFRRVSMMRDLLFGLDFLLALEPDDDGQNCTNSDIVIESVQNIVMTMVALLRHSGGDGRVMVSFAEWVTKLESIHRLAPFDISELLSEVLDDLSA